MPWRTSSAMSERHEFVLLASQPEANVRGLCRRFGISSRTAYKWLNRYLAEGDVGLAERSRKPKTSPLRTSDSMEQLVTKLRQRHPQWGGRKLGQRLADLGHPKVPSPSTITAILQRQQLLAPSESEKHQAWVRFEHRAPNDLWQMDFKGEFALQQGGRCFPLTVLDDHSRFALGLEACSNVQTEPTKAVLIEIFRRYGLPTRITCDNGPPWGIANCKYTKLAVWLLRLGIIVSHSRPHHPQTQGKDERFHRTLGAEVLRYLIPVNLAVCQQRFVQWRYVYNNERPHEALGLKVPAKCYQPSNRAYPETLPALEYGPSDIVKKVQPRGHIKYQGREYYLSMAFAGQHVALRFTNTDGLLDVYFAQHPIATINLAR
jgi:transposase InsO family protein